MKNLSETFYNNFIHLKETPLVLYGVGKFTEQIVEQVKGFRIVGLMDAKTTGQTIYGFKVLSETEVAAIARAVIIVSNLSIAKTIYRRIESFVKEHQIEVYYLNGLQPQDYDTAIAENIYWIKSEQALQTRIQNSEVITFDIFDTLLMRRCHKPEDVFGFVAHEMGLNIAESEFTLRRKSAEKICYQHITQFFNIEQIYDVLLEEGIISECELPMVIKKEVEIERRFLIQRECMCELLRYAKEHGKTVILVSDMYLRYDVLRDILESLNICEYDELLISCEVKKDKYWGSMWEYVSSLYPGRKLLHIGDDEISDEKTAEEHGIETYWIAGANDLLRMSDITRYLGGGEGGALGDKLILGLFAAKAANNPFCMSRTKGKLYISNMFEFGYLFFGPLVLNYLLWLIDSAKEQQIDTILFVARDGYLLEKLYKKLIYRKQLEAPRGVYYLSSRRAASVASVETVEDIWFIFENLCNTASVQYKRIMEKAFGIKIDEDDKYLNSTIYEVGKKELFGHTVSKYVERIFKNAERERKNYFEYLKKLQLGDKLGFVNFVCRGVTQYCTSKMMKKRLKGFYFASEEDILDIYPHMEDIFCLYGENVSTHTSTLNLVAKYLYGETILSAPNGQLICFSEEGMPIYEKNRRSFEKIQECHEGIEKYMDDMLKMVPDLQYGIFSNELIDQMYGLFDLENVILAPEVKDVFCFEDYYGEGN